MGQQLFDPAIELRRQAREHVLEVSPRIPAIELVVESRPGSMRRLTTVCATQSATVGLADAAPARVTHSMAPFLFGLVPDRLLAGAL